MDIDTKKLLIDAHKLLEIDQYDHGEWGKCESADPTEDLRNMELSKIKPNIFISTQAILSLLSTGYNNRKTFDKFFNWINAIRNDDGFWTSASGARIPAGKSRGWSEVHNIRHTAKSLDLLMLKNKFVSSDFDIFKTIIESQNLDGSYSQHPDGAPDIWSTAYVMNLIIRSLSPDNLKLTLPRNTNINNWESNLRNRLSMARAWICSQLNDDGFWSLHGKEPVWITEAILAEVGGDLCLNRPDICKLVSNSLLNKRDKISYLTLWSLLLVSSSLLAEDQKQVNQILKKEDFKSIPDNTYELSCYCRLIKLKFNSSQINYYIIQSNGHESTLTLWRPWSLNEYEEWCVSETISLINSGKTKFKNSPIVKTESWLSAKELINNYKNMIENNNGWRLFWKNDSLRYDEKIAQIHFWTNSKSFLKNEGVIIREPETGSGPVDFEFNNGFTERIYIEIKLASNPKYLHGLNTQLITYMNSEDINSAFYILIGFSPDDKTKFDNLYRELEKIKHIEKRKFIDIIFIDASRQVSASKKKSA